MVETHISVASSTTESDEGFNDVIHRRCISRANGHVVINNTHVNLVDAHLSISDWIDVNRK